MSIEIHFGEVTLRDDLVLGFSNLRVEPNWQVVLEDAFRSPQKFGHGVGNASVTVRFELLTQHISIFDRANYQRAIYYSLYGNNLVTPRELWILDTGISPIPFSFGLALANPPKHLHDREGHDGVGVISVTDFEFVCDLLPNEDIGLVPDSVINPPSYAPNFWIPNQYGIVLRRDGDGAWIQLTRDFNTNEFVFSNLGADPGSTNYDLSLTDIEWPDSNRAFGLYQDTPTPIYELEQINNLPENTPKKGTSASDFVTGYTSLKGVTFVAGKGPVLRTPDNRRFRMVITLQNEIEFLLL